MQLTLAAIAKFIEGKVIGDENLIITGLSGVEDAIEGNITFLGDSKFLKYTKNLKASALIVSRDVNIPGISIIQTDNPSFAFTKLVISIAKEQMESQYPIGIHESVLLADDVVIGDNVSIGANAVIEKHTTIGNNTRIFAGSFIGFNVSIGDDCIIYPNVTVNYNSIIHNRVIVHSGTVIGSDGFGFVLEKGIHSKIPQIGCVEIEDDVEIGSNVSIDRARLKKTKIGRGSKIDNLVQIAHNVEIGEDCLIVSQAGMAGSVKVGNNVIFGGQSGVVGHVSIGDNSVLTARSGVTKNVPAGSRMLGFPAKPYKKGIQLLADINKISKNRKEIEILKKKIKELEDRLSDGNKAENN